jgi:hypothetical protein
VGGASALCNGGFSDGTSINVANPTYLNDVPGNQVFCDFHTFSWNQFLYFTQMQPDPNNGGQVTPLFLQQAPWYNALKPNGSPQPGAFPGGSTALQVSQLDQGQAGDDDQLLDVNNATVLYDIRFNSKMYNAIVNGNLYTETLFTTACQPSGTAGNCTNPLYLPPTTTSQPAAAGSVEIKSAWRDFGSPTACPAQQFYCNGRLGLVGLHIVLPRQAPPGLAAQGARSTRSRQLDQAVYPGPAPTEAASTAAPSPPPGTLATAGLERMQQVSHGVTGPAT